jgi:hypothetical protein
LDPVPEFLDFWARRFQLSFSKSIRSWSRAIAIGDVALIVLQKSGSSAGVLVSSAYTAPVSCVVVAWRVCIFRQKILQWESRCYWMIEQSGAIVGAQELR